MPIYPETNPDIFLIRQPKDLSDPEDQGFNAYKLDAIELDRKLSNEEVNIENLLNSKNMIDRINAVRNINELVAEFSSIPFFQKIWFSEIQKNKERSLKYRIHENDPRFMNHVVFEYLRILKVNNPEKIKPDLNPNKAYQVRIQGMAFMSDQRYIQIVDEMTKDLPPIYTLNNYQKLALSRNRQNTTPEELAKVLNIDEKEVKRLLLDRTFFEILNGLNAENPNMPVAGNNIYVQSPETRQKEAMSDTNDEYLDKINQALRLRRLLAAQNFYVQTVLGGASQVNTPRPRVSSPNTIATQLLTISNSRLGNMQIDLGEPNTDLPAFLQRQTSEPPKAPEPPKDSPEILPFLKGIEMENNPEKLQKIRSILGNLFDSRFNLLANPDFRRIILEVMKQHKIEGTRIQEGSLDFWQTVLAQYAIGVTSRLSVGDENILFPVNANLDPGDFQVDIQVLRLAAHDKAFMDILNSTSEANITDDGDLLISMQKRINGRDLDPKNISPLVLALVRGDRALSVYYSQFINDSDPKQNLRLIDYPSLDRSDSSASSNNLPNIQYHPSELIQTDRESTDEHGNRVINRERDEISKERRDQITHSLTSSPEAKSKLLTKDYDIALENAIAHTQLVDPNFPSNGAVRLIFQNGSEKKLPNLPMARTIANGRIQPADKDDSDFDWNGARWAIVQVVGTVDGKDIILFDRDKYIVEHNISL